MFHGKPLPAFFLRMVHAGLSAGRFSCVLTAKGEQVADQRYRDAPLRVPGQTVDEIFEHCLPLADWLAS